MASTFRIGVEVETSGPDLSRAKVWDRHAMADLCAWSVLTVVERTTQQGVGADGAPFAPYSVKPRTVTYRSETGRRLTPKGGKPAYGRGHPRRLLVNDRPPPGRDWEEIGRHYPDGYAQYKRESRKGRIQSAEVDLVLSEQLMRNVDTLVATDAEGIVTVLGQARTYGPAVNEARPFLGHHQGEQAEMDAVIARGIEDALSRSLGTAGPAPQGPAFG